MRGTVRGVLPQVSAKRNPGVQQGLVRRSISFINLSEISDIKSKLNRDILVSDRCFYKLSDI